MDRLVLDTNVLVSALLTPGGPSARIFGLAGAQEVELAVSPAILFEYEEVLSRPKFAAVSNEARISLRELRANAIEVLPIQTVRACSDPDDDKFLECAVAACADFLVTGNERDFPRAFETLKIVSPAAYLRGRTA